MRLLSSTQYLAVVAIISATAQPLVAQDQAVRTRLLLLRDSTLAINDPETLAALKQSEKGAKGADRDALRLYNGFLSERRGELTTERRWFNDGADAFDRVAHTRKSWPLPWYAAGFTERALARTGLPVLPSAIHALGYDYNQSAVIAFTRALRTDSTFAPAADGVADALWATTRWGVAKVAVEGLRKASRLSPTTVTLRAIAEREAGDRDSVAPLLRRALALGGDSALNLLELAREEFYRGNVEAGQAAYSKGVAMARSPQSLTWLKRSLAFVASAGELDAFDSWTDAERVTAVEAFWTRRDVESAMKPGSRLAEHFRRYELAREMFRPNEAGFTPIERSAAATAGRGLLTEKCRQEELEQINAREKMSMEAKQQNPLDGSGVGGQANLTAAGSLLPQAEDRAEELDVRGVAVMRYGEPDDFAGTFWRFNSNGQPLVFRTNYCHAGGPCNLDARYCALMPSRELYQQWQREWKEAWDTVRSTNRMQRKFREALTPSGDAFGLFGEQGDSGRILVAFAVPARQLDADSLQDRFLYPLRIEIVAAPLSSAFRVDRDTTRRFSTEVRLGRDALLQGVEVLNVPAGVYRLRIVFETPDGRRGSVVADDEIIVPDARRDQVTLSDLVLGRDESHLTWWSGRDRVRLNPVGSVKQSELLYTFYQVAGLTAGQQYRTSLELFDGSRTDVEPLLSLAFDDVATSSRVDQQRTLGLDQVKTGLHTIRVTIRNAVGDVVARKAASVRIE